MRILNVGGTWLADALRRQGHTVLTLGTGGGCDIVVTHPYYTSTLLSLLTEYSFSPDLLFYADEGNLPLLLSPVDIPFPTVWYSIDTYCNPWHIPYAIGFDYVLVAQKDFLPLFTREGYKAEWLPLFCREEGIIEGSKRDVPVSFVGTLGHKNNPSRAPFLAAFRTHHPLVFYQGAFAPLFLRSQIVLNQTAFSEVNFRCFEAPALGAALLMERCANGLFELFVEGEEILPTYTRGDAAEAADIARNALANPLRLAAIARAGQARVRRDHTDTVRAKTLSRLFLSLCQAGTGDREREYEHRNTIVRGAFGVIATDLSNDYPKEKHFFTQLALGKVPRQY